MRRSGHPALRHRQFARGPLLVLGLCLGLAVGGFAVEKVVLQDVILRNWDLDDGLISTRVNAVADTPDGFLWVATQRGLVRFDGNRFVACSLTNIPGLKENHATCLLVDAKGVLWAGFSGRLLRKTEAGFAAQDLGMTTGGRRLNALAEDAQGALWLATDGAGLVRFHDGRAEAFSTDSGLPSAKVAQVLCDARGKLWAVAGGQLITFEEGRWRAPPGAVAWPQTVSAIARANDGGLWAATITTRPLGGHSTQVYKLKETGWSAEFEPYPWPEDSQQFHGLTMFEDRGGRLWCVTGGSVFFKPPRGPWQRLVSTAPWIQVEALCLTEDENGMLWIGTRTTGLLQVRPRPVTAFPLPAFASQHAVLTACAARDGSVWGGTDGAGIFRWRGDEVSHYDAEQGLTNLQVAVLLEDHQTNLWAGTFGGLFRRVGERFVPVPETAALCKPILTLLEDHQGALWAGGHAGLVRLEGQSARVFGPSDGLPRATVRALAEDREGRLWVGTTEAELYRQENEHFRGWPMPQKPVPYAIRALHCDGAGALWIGTDFAGLLRLQNGHFDDWDWSRDGLPSNYLSAIVEDGDGVLWFSSENGIFGCSKQMFDEYQQRRIARLQPRRLTPSDGLAHKVCSGVGQPAASRSPDGRLWFPDGPALAVFNPSALPRQARVWPPLIESVLVDGVLRSPAKDGLQVKSGARRIEFQYTSPNLVSPEQLLFRIRLEGLDREWVEARTRREVSYYHLPPGSYEFKVIASGPEGVWQEGRALRLEVIPRFWERRSFQLAAGLGLLAGVAGAVWAIERSRSRRRLERLELQRRMDAERQRIARDIHDDLGSGLTEIILMSDSLGEEGALAPSSRKVVGEVSACARALTRAMDEVVWAINPRNDTLESLLTYFNKFVQTHLTVAGVRCRWDVPLEVPELFLSAEIRHNLYLACKEALNNVTRHAGASEVWVRLAFIERGFTLSIEDDGKGFSASAAPARGNGLANMRQRLEAVHGNCRIESAPGRGTRVVFSVPVAMHTRAST